MAEEPMDLFGGWMMRMGKGRTMTLPHSQDTDKRHKSANDVYAQILAQILQTSLWTHTRRNACGKKHRKVASQKGFNIT